MPTTSKDAVQETFLRLYRQLRKYDETKSFQGWVSRIMVNVCRDHALRHRPAAARICTRLARVCLIPATRKRHVLSGLDLDRVFGALEYSRGF